MKLVFILFLFSSTLTFSQERFLDVAINNNQFLANDTISIQIEYVDDYNNKISGTLYLKVMNEKGATWNFRWPIYNGLSAPKIILPKDIERGFYHLYFATRDDKFLVKGTLLNNMKNDKLNATLYNKENLIVTNDIPINFDNSFTYTNPYYRDEAILYFANAKDKGKKPNIKINAILDSTFTPTTSKYISIKVGGLNSDATPGQVPKNYADVDSYLGKKIVKMEMATVKATNKQKAKNFEENYIGDFFKDMGERTLNLFEDDPALYGQTLFTYLQNSVPNLVAVRNDENSQVNFTLRGNPITWFLDQVEVPSEVILNIDLNDVAIIKVYNPPFALNNDASMGAVALFSKRNTNSANGKNSFSIKGYSSPIEILTNSKVK